MYGYGVRSLQITGALILIGVGAYYGMELYNTSKLDEIPVKIEGPAALPELPSGQPEIYGAMMRDDSFKPIQAVGSDISFVEHSPPETVPAQAQAPAAHPTVVDPARLKTPEPIVQSAPSDERDSTSSPMDAVPLIARYNSIYPGIKMHPKYWDRPLLAGTNAYVYGVVKRPDGFFSVSTSQGLPRGTVSDATHIRIPSIGVDSAVTNLSILELGDSRQYETPKQVVGRIPDTSNPGELGNAWLFGHLESPIRGEGNVFKRLPEIPSLVNSGDPVYVSVLNEDGYEFLYQVTATEVVHQDDLSLYDTNDSTITLVACVPRLVYDHRILVTGKLVGIRIGG